MRLWKKQLMLELLQINIYYEVLLMREELVEDLERYGQGYALAWQNAFDHCCEKHQKRLDDVSKNIRRFQALTIEELKSLPKPRITGEQALITLALIEKISAKCNGDLSDEKRGELRWALFIMKAYLKIYLINNDYVTVEPSRPLYSENGLKIKTPTGAAFWFHQHLSNEISRGLQSAGVGQDHNDPESDNNCYRYIK
jgi:hypothetical protein